MLENYNGTTRKMMVFRYSLESWGNTFMQKRKLRKLILTSLGAGLLSLAPVLPMATVMPVLPALSAPTAFAAVQVNPIPGLRSDFIMGADVSMLPQMESVGAKFYDTDGTKMDELQIMKNHGVNWVRVRLWNNPKDGPGGGGEVDEARALALTKRAHALGMKVLLDYHYSDWWADPGQQNTPKAWESDDEDQLVQDVHDFTKKVFNDFQAAGEQPEMVQIGNELKSGMLWPIGRLPSTDDGAAFSRLMQAGLSAVRESDPDRKTRLMIHLPDGTDNDLYRRFFDMLADNGVTDFDIIGLSYYPFWHGAFTKFQENVDDISARYDKDIVVAETAFGWTTENFDGENNHFDGALARKAGVLPTVQGQATGLRKVMECLANIPNGRGLGSFYWEPDWYAVPGAGWAKGKGNNWENLAMFDQNGKALDSWDVYKDVTDQSLPTVPVTAVKIENIALEGAAGIPVQLPKTVLVTLSDDSTEDMAVTWESAAPAYEDEGSYTVNGTIDALGDSVTASITVKKGANLLVNGNFDTMTLAGWTIDGDEGAVAPKSGKGDAVSGGAAHYWAKGAFHIDMHQTVENLPDGLYTAEVMSQGKGEAVSYELYVETNGERYTAPMKDTGWNVWSKACIKDIEVKDGKATIGIDLNGKPDDWGSIDEVKFYKQ